MNEWQQHKCRLGAQASAAAGVTPDTAELASTRQSTGMDVARGALKTAQSPTLRFYPDPRSAFHDTGHFGVTMYAEKRKVPDEPLDDILAQIYEDVGPSNPSESAMDSATTRHEHVARATSEGSRRWLEKMPNQMTLDKFILDNKMPLRVVQTIGLAIQLARGLQHLHDHGRILGVLNPQRVRVNEDGQARILPWMDYSPEAVPHPRWTSPERLNGDLPSMAADRYGLGMLLYMLLRRKPPFEGEKPAAVCGRVLSGERPPIPGETPAGFSEVLHGLWLQDPKSRMPLDKAIQKLERVLTHLKDKKETGEKITTGESSTPGLDSPTDRLSPTNSSLPFASSSPLNETGISHDLDSEGNSPSNSTLYSSSLISDTNATTNATVLSVSKISDHSSSSSNSNSNSNSNSTDWIYRVKLDIVNYPFMSEATIESYLYGLRGVVHPWDLLVALLRPDSGLSDAAVIKWLMRWVDDSPGDFAALRIFAPAIRFLEDLSFDFPRNLNYKVLAPSQVLLRMRPALASTGAYRCLERLEKDRCLVFAISDGPMHTATLDARVHYFHSHSKNMQQIRTPVAPRLVVKPSDLDPAQAPPLARCDAGAIAHALAQLHFELWSAISPMQWISASSPAFTPTESALYCNALIRAEHEQAFRTHWAIHQVSRAVQPRDKQATYTVLVNVLIASLHLRDYATVIALLLALESPILERVRKGILWPFDDRSLVTARKLMSWGLDAWLNPLRSDKVDFHLPTILPVPQLIALIRKELPQLLNAGPAPQPNRFGTFHEHIVVPLARAVAVPYALHPSALPNARVLLQQAPVRYAADGSCSFILDAAPQQ